MTSEEYIKMVEHNELYEYYPALAIDIHDALIYINHIFYSAIVSKKHKPGDWRKAGNWQHLRENFQGVESPLSNDSEDHLANMICRGLLLLQLRLEEEKDDIVF